MRVVAFHKLSRMAALEDILTQLLVPDNAAVNEATRAFYELAKQPHMYGCVPDLIRILQTHPFVSVSGTWL
jgi:hypothetical protein